MGRVKLFKTMDDASDLARIAATHGACAEGARHLKKAQSARASYVRAGGKLTSALSSQMRRAATAVSSCRRRKSSKTRR